MEKRDGRSLYPVQIGGKTKFTKVSSNGQSAFAIDKEGFLYGWGNNHVGQLGNGSKNNKLVPTKAICDKKFKEILHGGGGRYCYRYRRKFMDMWN